MLVDSVLAGDFAALRSAAKDRAWWCWRGWMIRPTSTGVAGWDLRELYATSSGTLDPTFNPNADHAVYAIAK